MPYNNKQYSAALAFLGEGDDNVTDAKDQQRIQVYDFYENLYDNASVSLELVLRGEDQVALLIPNGKKIVEATHRFLGKNLDYFVDAGGDEAARISVDDWWKDFYSREALRSKFESSKRWGLVRGDAYFYVYAKPNKTAGKRLCVKELDPRCVFEISEDPHDADAVSGVHIVDKVQDFREPEKPDKQITRRRTFRKVFNDDSTTAVVTSELTFWEIGKWDDRTVKAKADQERVPNVDQDEDVFDLGSATVPITNLPVYKWRTRSPQNSTWGRSILFGLETCLYAINQSLTDEDATIVFQGLGMYVTTSGPPIDPDTGDIGEWAIGPKRVIEISENQTFSRVTGVDSVQPFQDHMGYINDKGLSEASGTPEIAIGRVDVQAAESGISLKLQMGPLLASNAELELEMISVLDQFHFDITSQWLPAYEFETFGDAAKMVEISVVALFDDPMPRDNAARVTELIALDGQGMILKVMVVQELRKSGYVWPATDVDGNPVDDWALAQMLIDQSAAVADAQLGSGLADTGAVDEFGNPIPPDQQQSDPNTPDQTTVDLGTT